MAMDYLKPDEINKFNELVARLTDTVFQMRIITKRMGIKEVSISLLNYTDDDWKAEIRSASDIKDDEFTSFKAEIPNGRTVETSSQIIKHEEK